MADWKEQSLRLWQKLDRKQKIILVGCAAFLFFAILAWSYWWGGRPEWVPLFTGLDSKDAGEIVAKLKETKVPYEIGPDGSTILVSAKDVYRVRLDLATQGLPRGNKGFEIFDQTKFGTTEFQNRVYLLQALQGELARTIEQLAEVEKARVHIVLPEDSLYRKNEKPATASIMLKLRPQAQLSKQQVRGIVNLVAHSISNLKPENITVVDSFARILNDGDESENQLAAGATAVSQMEITRKLQENMQRSLQSLLEQVLGPNKAAVRVTAELNFDQKTVDRQIFEPVVDDKGIIRSMQETTETYKGNTPNSGGPPGTTSNIPGYVTPATNSQSNYEKKEVTRNYEISETKEKVVVAPGSIKRLTVAVLVDGTLTRQQQDSITRAVASAVGYNQSRGDVVSVEAIPFSTEIADKQRQEDMQREQEQQRLLWIKIGSVVTLALLALIILRWYVRRKQQQQEEEMAAMMQVVPSEPISEEISVKDKQLTQQEKERAEKREQIEKLVKTRPEEAAQLLRVWLAEE